MRSDIRNLFQISKGHEPTTDVSPDLKQITQERQISQTDSASSGEDDFAGKTKCISLQRCSYLFR